MCGLRSWTGHEVLLLLAIHDDNAIAMAQNDTFSVSIS